MSNPKSIVAHNANEQTPIDGGVGEANFESCEVFTLPGSDLTECQFVFGFLSGIDRDSKVWKKTSELFKWLVEDNDRGVRQRMDLEKSNEGRLQLFLKDFQRTRLLLTENGSINPARWMIEKSCMEWWQQARWWRNKFGFNVLRPLPHLPEDFQNAAQVQNALNALEAWAQESIAQLDSAKPSAKPKSQRSDPQNVIYQGIRDLNLRTVSKIVAFIQSPEGKNLREMIGQELERRPMTRQKPSRKRTLTDVVEAALKSTYPSQQT